MGIANISIVGNVVRPPSQTSFSSGNTKTTIVVAVDSYKKGDQSGNNKTTEFYQVDAWGNLGDVVHRYIDKGNQVTAIGRLNIDRWQDKEGRDRITPVVSATQISLPPRRYQSNSVEASSPASTRSSGPDSSSRGSSTPAASLSDFSPPVSTTDNSVARSADETELTFTEAEEDAAAAAMFGPTTIVATVRPTPSINDDADMLDILDALSTTAPT
jgi:single-strand DNA-binding protein